MGREVAGSKSPYPSKVAVNHLKVVMLLLHTLRRLARVLLLVVFFPPACRLALPRLAHLPALLGTINQLRRLNCPQLSRRLHRTQPILFVEVAWTVSNCPDCHWVWSSVNNH